MQCIVALEQLWHWSHTDMYSCVVSANNPFIDWGRHQTITAIVLWHNSGGVALCVHPAWVFYWVRLMISSVFYLFFKRSVPQFQIAFVWASLRKRNAENFILFWHGMLNPKPLTGKGKELADTIAKRKVDVLYVQETRWKGSRTLGVD